MALLVCIDPDAAKPPRSATSTSPCCPGTDTAALALMHELIRHDWLDHDYIDRYTLGWDDALRERALKWPPARSRGLCGIAPEQIRQLGPRHGRTNPPLASA